jgi:hypothetical protein
MLHLQPNRAYKNRLAQEERKAICSFKNKPNYGNKIITTDMPVPG